MSDLPKTNDATGLSAATGSVYEIVDCTSEELFYPLGIYLTLDDALAAVMVDSPEQVGCVDHDEWDQSVQMEIRERCIGPSGHGTALWDITWSFSFDAEDEKLWSRRI